ncbi:hypothetical protein Taro_028159 [Colocasia esculenta]|uniref:DNA mismatch repair proteins mutS family domain-containing protein n=1 Tax=Colocasia esculenta TaxID=4460 RepID=A0A843VWF3_COLES|nr:hypothetical protein [Colocasia esculenta]
MSLLESFSEMGALLTIATTHHGELKTLKYSNKSFENACVEFDEVNLKPTYRILWGVPGRSNAINIAERLGLSSVVLKKARKLYGIASAEINGKLYEYSSIQYNKKVQAIVGAAAVTRSLLHTKLQQFRETSAIQTAEGETTGNKAYGSENSEHPSSEASGAPAPSFVSTRKQMKIPEVGDMVDIPSLGKKAMVLKVEASKGEITVQASNMKLRLKLSSIVDQQS